ncbi:MAG: Intracellular exo-alpha-L-arabinofuranosidase 2, partial [Verrucomicrobiota bacterium]
MMRLPRLTLLLLPVIVTAQNVTINVDANQVVRTVDERVFGANAVIWDGNAAAAQTITMLQAAGLRALRIPGGSLSDEYHWRTNTTLANTWTWSAHFPAFINVITALNAQTYATVNYGTGTPEEAAALVAYLNASTTATPNTINTVIGT